MLVVKLLDERVTSGIQEIRGYEFFSAENRTVKVQIYDDHIESGYQIPSGATVAGFFPTSSDDLEVSGTIDTSDRSIVTFTLSTTNTTNIVGGGIYIKITESGGNIRFAKLSNAITKLVK